MCGRPFRHAPPGKRCRCRRSRRPGSRTSSRGRSDAMTRWNWWARLLILLAVLGLLVLEPAAALADPGPIVTRAPSATATPDANYPLNSPCYQDPPGIAIGTVTATPI